jgi:gliding motility-associated-like protein
MMLTISDTAIAQDFIKKIINVYHPDYVCTPQVFDTKDEGWIFFTPKNSDPGLIIIKYDLCGGVDWSKELNFNGYVYCILKTNKGEFVITGNTPHSIFLIKINDKGDLVFQKKFSGSSTSTPIALSVDKDDNIYLLNYYNYLMKIDSNGALIWGKDFSFYLGVEFFRGILLSENGHIVLHARDIILLLTAEGNIVSAKKAKIKDESVRLYGLPVEIKGTYLFCGLRTKREPFSNFNYLVSFDSSLNLKWVSKSYLFDTITSFIGISTTRNLITKIEILNDSSFLTVGNAQLSYRWSGPKKIAVLKFNNQGNLLAENYYSTNDSYNYVAIHSSFNNGRLIINGYEHPENSNSIQTPFIFKRHLNTPGFCTTEYQLEFEETPEIVVEDISIVAKEWIVESEDFSVEISDFIPIEETLCYNYTIPDLLVTRDTTVCNKIILNCSASGMKSYAWSTGSNEKSISVEETGTYSLMVVSCLGDTIKDSTYVEVLKIPEPIIEEAYSICLTDSLFLNWSIPATKVHWEGFESPEITITKSGEYILFAENLCGKTIKKTRVDVEECFIVPNVFTPNNDNINDEFIIEGYGIKSMQGEIFNRWGKKVTDFYGSWNGANTNEGIYFYKVSITLTNFEIIEKKGFVTLLR